ncbi:MAG: sigma-54-dependent Fis family transcriptional regulator [Planctomycetaceae bacterium]|nr:MAG: sigma-54-dependent Fis family transcriptional regulator [Planctomycetaceae bacterium]
MERSEQLLLDVWREACRHIELSESAANIANLVRNDLPLEMLLVRQFDFSSRSVKTLAVGRSSPSALGLGADNVASVAKWERLIAWASTGKVSRTPANRRSGEMGLVVPKTLEGEALAGPLRGAGDPVGVLVATAPLNRAITDRDVRLFEMLIEPFSVALENHLRMHELSHLREIADSEKRKLLKRLGKPDQPEEVIVGAESGLRRVLDRVNLVASSDVPVLILGETGTGKEVVSRAIHARSNRHEGPFIRVNCGAIPPDLIDSQLFGHERGSFTGADAARQGWFERADGGTLFLDEIGELPPAAQVRLLRVLQDSFIERIGGQHPIRVDVRIVAATHRDLPSMVRAAAFREDLWYRINVFPLTMPPLRDRPEDIPKLVRHFAARAAQRFGLPTVEPSSDDMLVMIAYRWPGNIRELAAVIDRAVILGEGTRLDIRTALGGWSNESTPPATPSDEPTFYEVIPESLPPRSIPTTQSPANLGEPLSLNDAIRQHIEQVLRRVHGKIEGPQGAADLLQVNPHTLRAKMRKLKIDWDAFRR